MILTAFLDHIALDPSCIIVAPRGQRKIGPGQVVPEDMQAFYDACGGLIIAQGSPYEVRITGPDECVRANDVILGEDALGDLAAVVREQLSGNALWDWYVIVEVDNGNYLAIDLGGGPHNADVMTPSGKPTHLPAKCPSLLRRLLH